MRLLLVTPPMTQLNTPYPATAYLTGHLRSRGWDVRQADPALELVLRLFSREGLARVRETVAAGQATTSPKAKGPSRAKRPRDLAPCVEFFLEAYEDYARTVEPVIRFLQGRDPSLALRIAARTLLPEGPRFAPLSGEQGQETLAWAFGAMGDQDRARYLASLYLDDLADVIREAVDPRFLLSRYGEKLAASAPTFDPLLEALEAEPTLVDTMLDEITAELLREHEPDVLGLTLPFPGNVYGGLRMARAARAIQPSLKVLAGGGYVNTELRDLKDARIFDYVDYITLDDGERPLECLLEHLSGKRPADRLLRTLVREGGKAKLLTTLTEHDIPFKDAGAPTMDGLPIDRYFSMLEMPNPVHRLWSDLRWNKVTLAHGCYWRKCSFCDVKLDYIERYDAAPAGLTLERMEKLARETGSTGFHFVDEAAPPAVLKTLSKRILEKGATYTWWGNVRFDKAFTPELADLMADAGCVAVTGGIEVASDRLLKLMNKGVTIEQVARVTRAFRDAGILVHAYLMYGFPTQSLQETIDSLEIVRQLFAEGCLQSGFWHRFSATAHSPVGREPHKYGITLDPVPEPAFARNDLAFTDPTGVDHDRLGLALRKALYNYMLGVGLDNDVREWFREFVPGRIPRATEDPRRIRNALE